MIGWIKSNLGIVILLIVTVAVPPVTWFISSGWNKKIRDGQEELAQADYSKLQKAQVNYSVPSWVPGQEQIQLFEVPNAKLTAWFLDQRERQLAEAEELIGLGEARSRRNHGVLVEGLFPDPESRQKEQTKPMEFAKAITPGASAGKLSAYEMLLKKINAGPVADATLLGDVLADFKEREVDRIKSQGSQTSLTQEQTDELTVKLQSRRIGAYQSRAREISCYATFDAFSRINTESPYVPKKKPSKPTVETCFAWQHDIWVTTDIFDAIAVANTGPDGRMFPLERAVVKRIKRIRMTDLPLFSKGRGDRSDKGYESEGDRYLANQQKQEQSASIEVAGTDGTVPINYGISLTGRYNDKDGNKIYDVRKVELTLVVSSARVLDLLDAIERTGFMEVLDLDISEVDIWGDLSSGFYYGSEHVVQAKLAIETVWLRSWATQYTPKVIRSILGHLEETSSDEREDG